MTNEVTAGIIRVAKGMHLKVLGPARLPVKVMNIGTRLAPCPKGSNLRGKLKLQIYGTIVEVFSSMEAVDQIISGYNEHDVEIEFLVVDVGGWCKRGGVGASLG
ncbi:hypothetical protein POM88_050756 [Heracleum sosnowskyi]|uniref:Small ribosomal subunit protein uS10 domain-containing protein n=1 Tax=Heracleum sosnowskyi TaxID=360622 RepID=A0AAD8GY62_9APIA|nr:hypothetical protein POM88_050756 [Heracleum sosnowskyi]